MDRERAKELEDLYTYVGQLDAEIATLRCVAERLQAERDGAYDRILDIEIPGRKHA